VNYFNNLTGIINHPVCGGGSEKIMMGHTLCFPGLFLSIRIPPSRIPTCGESENKKLHHRNKKKSLMRYKI